MFKMLFLVTTVGLGHIVSSQTSPSCLYPTGCRHVNIFDYPLSSQSPYYEQVLTVTGDVCDLDNVCITMYPFDNNTLLYIRSAVYKNGTNYIGRFIYSGVSGHPGAFAAQGVRDSSGCRECFYSDYYLGSPCDEVYVLYRCLIHGFCARLYSELDNRVALSTYRRPQIPGCCYPGIEALATSQTVLRGSEFYHLPNLMPRRCVTRFNGAKCINADSVAPGDQVSLRYTVGCL